MTITATDSSGLSDEITVTINVTDVNDAPTFDGETATRAVAENSEAGVDIGAPVAATDPDDERHADLRPWTRTDAASFGIVAMSGQLQTKVPLDHETTPSYTVIVSVSDGKDTSGAPDSTTDDEITVTINVTDVNDAPEFDGETATRSIAENTAAGENIGAPITATDQDNGDVLTYFLSPTSALFFHIVPTSGQLQTKIALDHEATVRYSMYVFVRDSKDANGAADTLKDDKIEVNITVTDVNDAPEFDGETATRLIAENTAAGENIGAPITASDDDDATLTYTLGLTAPTTRPSISSKRRASCRRKTPSTTRPRPATPSPCRSATAKTPTELPTRSRTTPSPSPSPSPT